MSELEVSELEARVRMRFALVARELGERVMHVVYFRRCCALARANEGGDADGCENGRRRTHTEISKSDINRKRCKVQHARYYNSVHLRQYAV